MAMRETERERERPQNQLESQLNMAQQNWYFVKWLLIILRTNQFVPVGKCLTYVLTTQKSYFDPR